MRRSIMPHASGPKLQSCVCQFRTLPRKGLSTYHHRLRKTLSACRRYRQSILRAYAPSHTPISSYFTYVSLISQQHIQSNASLNRALQVPKFSVVSGASSTCMFVRLTKLMSMALALRCSRTLTRKWIRFREQTHGLMKPPGS